MRLIILVLSFLIILCGFLVFWISLDGNELSSVAHAATIVHPAPDSMGEPSSEKPFGYLYDEVRGDYRHSLGEQESTIQLRDAFLTYFINRVTGARSESVNTTTFVIQPTDEADWEIIRGKTGYPAYYVGKHDANHRVIEHLERAIDNYAKFYNGNPEYMKSIILNEVQGKPDYYSFRSEPFFHYGNPRFSIQDMFLLTGDDLFFNLSYISRLSGAGNTILVDRKEPEWNPYDPDADPLEFFSEPRSTYQTVATEWPTIDDVKILDNGDMQYTVNIHAIYDNMGRVDIIGNFEQNKMKLPTGQLANIDEYWRKHAFEYYRNMVADQSNVDPFRNYICEQEIPISAQPSQTFTHTVPKSEVERILADNGNTLTLYVTDNYGRYAYKEVPYELKKESCLRFSRSFRDHGLVVNLPKGTKGIGADVKYSLTYNKNLCAMDEVVTFNNDITYGHHPEKNIYTKHLNLWKVYVSRANGGGVEVKNRSSSESKPLVVELRKGIKDEFGTVVDTFTLAKGATKQLNIPAEAGDYFLYFPTPSEVSGFWDDKEFIMSKRKASKKFPDYIMPYVNEMLEKYGQP